MALAAIKEADPDVKEAKEAKKRVELVRIGSLVKKIHVIGEIEEGSLDCDQLVEELVRIAAALGAPRTKWKAH
jgi:hypothetical protein